MIRRILRYSDDDQAECFCEGLPEESRFSATGRNGPGRGIPASGGGAAGNEQLFGDGTERSGEGYTCFLAAGRPEMSSFSTTERLEER